MRKHLLLSIKILTTFGLLYWIATKIDFDTLKNFKHTLNLDALSLGMTFVAAQFFAGVWRWCLILPVFHVHQPFRTALQIYWMGMFFNSCLPTGIAGDVLRVQMMRGANTSIFKLTNAVFLDRLIGLLVVLLIVESSLFIFKSMLSSLPILSVFQTLALFGSLGFIALSYLHRLPITWPRFRLTRIIQQLSLDTNLLWQFPFQTSLMFIATLLGNIGQVLAIYFLARSLHLPITLQNCWVFVPMIIVAMSLPISIGGWGVREGAMITFFSLIGISKTAAFSLSVLFGVMMFLIYIPGGIFWILWRKKNSLVGTTLQPREL